MGNRKQPGDEGRVIKITKLKVMAPNPVVGFVWSEREKSRQKKFDNKSGNPKPGELSQSYPRLRVFDLFRFSQVSRNTAINTVMNDIDGTAIA